MDKPGTLPVSCYESAMPPVVVLDLSQFSPGEIDLLLGRVFIVKVSDVQMVSPGSTYDGTFVLVKSKTSNPDVPDRVRVTVYVEDPSDMLTFFDNGKVYLPSTLLVNALSENCYQKHRHSISLTDSISNIWNTFEEEDDQEEEDIPVLQTTRRGRRVKLPARFLQ